jgi:uncharacterized Tic20 family protein
MDPVGRADDIEVDAARKTCLDKSSAAEHEDRMDAVLPPLPRALPPALPASRSDDKIWAVGCHLSIFLGLGILVPLIILLAKRDESPFVGAHAREALNFHLSLILFWVIFALSCAVLGVSLIGIPLLVVLAVPAALLLVFVPLVLAIVATAKAANGEFFHYPLAFPIFR